MKAHLFSDFTTAFLFLVSSEKEYWQPLCPKLCYGKLLDLVNLVIPLMTKCPNVEVTPYVQY